MLIYSYKHFSPTRLLFLSIAVLVFFSNALNAQVLTRIIDESSGFEKLIPWYFQGTPAMTYAADIDIQQILEWDEINQPGFERQSIAKDIVFTHEAGTLYEFGNYSVWRAGVQSNGASNIRLKFVDTYLPEGSAMFVFSPSSKWVIGPITKSNLHNGKLNTDIIKGELAIVDVFLPHDVLGEWKLHIKSIVHGLSSSDEESYLSFDDDYQESSTCSPDAACSEADDYRDEISSVCKIMSDNGSCSGALLNNECNDFTPYVLTAEHCFPSFDASDLIFRFKYESPTCPPDPGIGYGHGTEPAPNTWVVFSGATLRASDGGTRDFALFELFDPVKNLSDLMFAGWDRRDIVPTRTAVIHHPKGDIKKYSEDVDSPSIDDGGTTYSINFDPLDGDVGIVEFGSSGSPHFDQNQRVVGQISTASTGNCFYDISAHSGRLFSSWTGGGTDDSRLSTWLGPNNAPNFVNGVTPPVIVGKDVLCSSSGILGYELTNPLPGHTVSWEVTPASSFDSPTSGTGLIAALEAVTPSGQTNGNKATLTFTLVNPNGCVVEINKDFWVGNPAIFGIKGTNKCFTPNSNVNLGILAQGAEQYSWSFPYCPSGPPVGDPTPGCWFNYTGDAKNIIAYVGEQAGSISAYVTNQCGTASLNRPIEYCEDDKPGEGPIIRNPTGGNNGDGKKYSDAGPHLNEMEFEVKELAVFPVPTSDQITINLPLPKSTENASYTVMICNMSGKIVKQERLDPGMNKLNVSMLAQGTYVIKAINENSYFVGKMIVQ